MKKNQAGRRVWFLCGGLMLLIFGGLSVFIVTMNSSVESNYVSIGGLAEHNNSTAQEAFNTPPVERDANLLKANSSPLVRLNEQEIQELGNSIPLDIPVEGKLSDPARSIVKADQVFANATLDESNPLPLVRLTKEEIELEHKRLLDEVSAADEQANKQ